MVILYFLSHSLIILREIQAFRFQIHYQGKTERGNYSVYHSMIYNKQFVQMSHNRLLAMFFYTCSLISQPSRLINSKQVLNLDEQVNLPNTVQNKE